MRVFVTGATGFVGQAVVPELLGAGHQVLGLARSETAAQALTAAGAEAHRGDLDDLDSLRRGVEAADAVVHLAFIHDFGNYAAAAETDRRAIQALGAALAGSGRRLVVTTGLAGQRPAGQVLAEDDATGPSLRQSEAATLALAGQGVHAAVVRLPSSVHGAGDYAFVPRLIELARQHGHAAYVGEGLNRWPAVHRHDAARLYRLVLEQGEAGARYHAVADEGIAFRELAATIGRHLGVPVQAKSPEEAAGYFGWLAGFAAMDLAASSALTRQRLGWQPTELGLLADMAAHYFAG